MIESVDGFIGNRHPKRRSGGSIAGPKTDSIDFQMIILARQSEEVV
jgi:hypothetical protein